MVTQTVHINSTPTLNCRLKVLTTIPCEQVATLTQEGQKYSHYVSQLQVHTTSYCTLVHKCSLYIYTVCTLVQSVHLYSIYTCSVCIFVQSVHLYSMYTVQSVHL